ncbi:MAG: O-antigen ligase family protein [Alphaproteobacteria bacterium]
MTAAEPAAEAGRIAGAGIRMVLVAVLAACLYFVPRATVIVFPAITIASYALSVRGPGFTPGFTHRALLGAVRPALPLLGVALLSVAWALEPATSFSRALRLIVEIGLATLLFVLVPREPGPALRRMIAPLAAGLIGASLLALADVKLDGLLSAWLRPKGAPIGIAYSLSGALHTMFALPLAVALWRTGRPILAGTVLVSVLSIAAVGSSTATVALSLALLAGLGVLALPGLRWLVLGIQLVALLAMPLVLPISVNERICDLLGSRSSALHRIAIWNFAYEQWRARPVLGWGLESSRDLGAKRQVQYMAGCAVPGGNTDPPPMDEALPLHPHSFIVQVWLELGALGALAMAWLIIHLSLRAWRAAPDRWGHAAITGFSVATFTIASSSYGLWQSWWVATLVIGGGLALLCSRIASRGIGTRLRPPDNAPPGKAA